MELTKQVVSLEMAKRLKELGVKQESLFYWDEVWSMKLGTHHDIFSKEIIEEDELPPTAISAFSVAELGEMLPVELIGDEGMRFELFIWKGHVGWNIAYWWDEDTRRHSGMRIENVYADTEADARAKMLIYLLENKLITL